MNYIVSEVSRDEVKPALELARIVFMELVAPGYKQQARDKLIKGCIENDEYIENYLSGRHLMMEHLTTKILLV